MWRLHLWWLLLCHTMYGTMAVCDTGWDLLFAIDESGSVDDADFSITKQLMMDVVDVFSKKDRTPSGSVKEVA